MTSADLEMRDVLRQWLYWLGYDANIQHGIINVRGEWDGLDYTLVVVGTAVHVTKHTESAMSSRWDSQPKWCLDIADPKFIDKLVDILKSYNANGWQRHDYQNEIKELLS
jgi:hypothetical protein